ncbi:hypothetical protein GuL6_014 [Buttiauxella phage vB_ButM_GuL6]|nr:hypothetical protein GuL6_014 [Buttiauxella phage vB_ButM_GuL6]
MMVNGSMQTQAIKQWTQMVQDAERGIAYCNEALASDLEAWERKEYEAVKQKHIDELPALKAHLNYLLNM